MTDRLDEIKQALAEFGGGGPETYIGWLIEEVERQRAAATLTLKEIPHNRLTLKEYGCRSDLISAGKLYLIIHDDTLWVGTFSEEWYGWHFNGWHDAGLQLDCIDGNVYEITSGLEALGVNRTSRIPSYLSELIEKRDEDEVLE